MAWAGYLFLIAVNTVQTVIIQNVLRTCYGAIASALEMNMNKPTVEQYEEYVQLLRSHDWHYDYSDDQIGRAHV